MRQVTRRSTFRAVGLALCLGVTLTSATSCGAFGDGQAAKQQKQAQERLTESERARIQKELAIFDHVTQAVVGYNDAWPEKGTVSVALGVPIKYKNLTETYYEAATKAVWLSRIDPLDTIDVYVGFEVAKGPGIVSKITPLLGDQGRSELTRRYGPRPHV